MLVRMSERVRSPLALRTAIDGFMERAQYSGGLVCSIDAMEHLLVDGVLPPEHGANDGQAASALRIVTVMSRLRAKEKPFLVAVLSGRHIASPLLASAEVSHDAAYSPSAMFGEQLRLPSHQLDFIQETVEMAKPKFVEPTEAELLYQRATGYLALN